MARFIQIFRKNDPEHRKLVREVNRQIARTAMELGYIPYKAPGFVAEMFVEKWDPTFREMMVKIKKMLDPNGIMNPGRLQL